MRNDKRKNMRNNSRNNSNQRKNMRNNSRNNSNQDDRLPVVSPNKNNPSSTDREGQWIYLERGSDMHDMLLSFIDEDKTRVSVKKANSDKRVSFKAKSSSKDNSSEKGNSKEGVKYDYSKQDYGTPSTNTMTSLGLRRKPYNIAKRKTYMAKTRVQGTVIVEYPPCPRDGNIAQNLNFAVWGDELKNDKESYENKDEQEYGLEPIAVPPSAYESVRTHNGYVVSDAVQFWTRRVVEEHEAEVFIPKQEFIRNSQQRGGNISRVNEYTRQHKERFKKPFVLLPICDAGHWSLIVLIDFFNNGPKPKLLHLDSFRTSRTETLHKLEQYKEHLINKWAGFLKYRISWEDVEEYTPDYLTTQRNMDCGLFCAKWTHSIIKHRNKIPLKETFDKQFFRRTDVIDDFCFEKEPTMTNLRASWSVTMLHFRKIDTRGYVDWALKLADSQSRFIMKELVRLARNGQTEEANFKWNTFYGDLDENIYGKEFNKHFEALLGGDMDEKFKKIFVAFAQTGGDLEKFKKRRNEHTIKTMVVLLESPDKENAMRDLLDRFGNSWDHLDRDTGQKEFGRKFNKLMVPIAMRELVRLLDEGKTDVASAKWEKLSPLFEKDKKKFHKKFKNCVDASTRAKLNGLVKAFPPTPPTVAEKKGLADIVQDIEKEEQAQRQFVAFEKMRVKAMKALYPDKKMGSQQLSRELGVEKGEMRNLWKEVWNALKSGRDIVAVGSNKFCLHKNKVKSIENGAEDEYLDTLDIEDDTDEAAKNDDTDKDAKNDADKEATKDTDKNAKNDKSTDGGGNGTIERLAGCGREAQEASGYTTDNSLDFYTKDQQERFDGDKRRKTCDRCFKTHTKCEGHETHPLGGVICKACRESRESEAGGPCPCHFSRQLKRGRKKNDGQKEKKASTKSSAPPTEAKDESEDNEQKEKKASTKSSAPPTEAKDKSEDNKSEDNESEDDESEDDEAKDEEAKDDESIQSPKNTKTPTENETKDGSIQAPPKTPTVKRKSEVDSKESIKRRRLGETRRLDRLSGTGNIY